MRLVQGKLGGGGLPGLKSGLTAFPIHFLLWSHDLIGHVTLDGPESDPCGAAHEVGPERV